MTAQEVGRQPVPHRRPRVPAAHRWRDVHQLEPRLGEEHRQPRADARVAALGLEERAIGRQEALPRGGRWDHAQRLALVVLDGEHAAGPERADELPHVRRRIRQEQEHPAREDDVVAAARQAHGGEIGAPDPAGPEAVAAARRSRPRANVSDGSTASTGPPTRRRSSRWSEPAPGPISSTRAPRRIFSRSKSAWAVGSQRRAWARSRSASVRLSPSR